MSESDPIKFSPALQGARPKAGGGHSSYKSQSSKGPSNRPFFLKPCSSHKPRGSSSARPERLAVASFTRLELNTILSLYGRYVASGEWRDYAIDLKPDHAVFSVFRRASEMPLYRIEKWPGLARRQGMFKVVALSGHILRRGHELKTVLRVLEPRQKLAPV